MIPEHHPVWFDILAALGEDVHHLDSLLYTITRAEGVTVVNSLPYIAYGGPSSPDPAPLRKLRALAEAMGADVLSVGTSPWLSEEEEQLYRDALSPTHVFENSVQLQSLTTHPLEQLSKKRRDAIESELRRCARAGIDTIDRLSEEQLEQWLAIYHRRYAEIGADPYPDAFHRELYRHDIAQFYGLVDDNNRLLGGIVFLVSTDTATYFSSAFDSDVRHLFPTTYLLNHAFVAFRERGIERFNWHSSPSQGGVHAYKQRWGAHQHRHFYLATLLKRDSALFSLEPRDVRRLFPFRFVLPFDAWPRTIGGE